MPLSYVYETAEKLLTLGTHRVIIKIDILASAATFECEDLQRG